MGSWVISRRLALGFGGVMVLLVLITAVSWWSLSRIARGLDVINDVHVAKAEQSQRLEREANHALIAMRNLSLAENPDSELKQLHQLRAALKRYDTEKQSLSAALDSEEERALFGDVSRTEAAARQILVDAAQQVGEAEPTQLAFVVRVELRRNVDRWDASQQAWIERVEALARLGSEYSRAHSASLQDDARRTRVMLVIAAAAALAVGVVASLLIARSVTRPLQASVDAARRIAQGDLSQAIQVDRADEIGVLQGALEGMRAQLHELASDVRAATDSIGNASNEIASGSTDLSVRTEQAAGHIEQTAHSMEQLAHSVRESALAAEQASDVAASASQLAGRGDEAVADVVATMGEISGSSHRIADIVGVIDSIAFQTNILALNAAVEAARAGEQGKGFAVVAGEVRTLAQRCAEAAREIKSLITVSTECVAQGAQRVENAGATMREVVAAVQQVSVLVREISDGVRAQDADIVQVNQALASLDEMSQQNAALVEEYAASAMALHDQAHALIGVVQRFRLSADRRVPEAPSPVEPPAGSAWQLA